MGSVYRGGKNVINMEEEHLESLNNSKAESLSAKVGQLKNLAFELDTEARDHIPLLDGLSEDMESGTIRLGGSARRIRMIGRTRGIKGNKVTCYVALLLVVGLLVFYCFYTFHDFS